MTNRLKSIVLLLALTLASLSVNAASSGNQQTWKINLKDVAIGEFITKVAEITGRNFVVDPRVKGRVTVVSSAALDAEGVYELFLSVLRVHGFAAVPAGDVTKIVQQTLAKQSASGADMDARAEGEQIITRVLPATNVPASELVKILRPLIPQYGHVAAVEDPNVIIISDHAQNIQRMEDVIDEIDVAQNDEVMMVSLEEAWVGSMVALLEKLAPDQVGRDAAGPQAVNVVANERNNSLVLRGQRSSLVELRQLIRKLDRPATQSGSTRVFYLRHSDAEQLAEILTGIVSEAQKQGDNQEQPVETSISADTSLNALVVRADPSTLAEVAKLIESLDVRRTQVLIEAAIVEVDVTNEQSSGVDFAVADRSGDAVPLIVNPLGGALKSLLGGSADGGGADGLSTDDIDLVDGGANLGSPTLAVAKLSNGISFAAILQALASTQDSDLLSTPSIMTLDNQEASIVVGQNVPFRTGSFTSSVSDQTNPFTTIQREDVGIELTVTPHINEGDTVRLEVQQEVSSVDESANVGSQAFSDIVTNNRTIETTILANHEQTIVLGGLIQDDIRTTNTRVPFLGSLPLAGRLFRSQDSERVKRNLLVFLRPTVLRDPSDVTAATERKYSGVWGLAPGAVSGKTEARDTAPPDMEDLYEGRPESAGSDTDDASEATDAEPAAEAETER